MHVSDILRRKGTQVLLIRADEPVSAAVERLRSNRIGALVVVDDDAGVAGIISERDIVEGLAEVGGGVLAHEVGRWMTRRLHVCGPADDIRDVMARMTEYRIRHLPVVEGDQLRGLISIGDVVKYRLDEVQTEARVLRDIVISR